MYYCDDCRIRKGWPPALRPSEGVCVDCGNDERSFEQRILDRTVEICLRRQKEGESAKESPTSTEGQQ